jgi:hypothetical protein
MDMADVSYGRVSYLNGLPELIIQMAGQDALEGVVRLNR